ncbi:MAG: hypothetical protein AAB263_07675 [Planctomycetota bacterium]
MYASRVGMSMVEVLVTATILTIAIGSLMSVFGQQFLARRSIDDQRAATTLVRSVATRLQSARWDYLGTPNMPWTYGRYQNTSHPTHPPLTWNAVAVNDNLQLQGLVDVDLNLKDLKVYIEWYRGVDATDSAGLPVAGQLGLLSQAGLTSARDFRVGTFVVGIPTQIKPGYWLVTTVGANWDPTSSTAPTECVGNDPLAARIVVSWTSKDRGPTQVELFTARSP